MNTDKTVYYLEDDWRYAHLTVQELKAQANQIGLQMNIRIVPTELEFLKTLDAIRAGDMPAADCFILDVMVQYDRPSPTSTIYQEALPPYDRCGIRCAELVLSQFPDAAVIFYSIVSAEDLPLAEFKGAVSHVIKGDNVTGLLSELRRSLQPPSASVGSD